MTRPLEDDINNILKQIDTAAPDTSTRPLHHTDEQEESKTIDVYIVVNEPTEEAEQEQIVESDLEQERATPQVQPPQPLRRIRLHPWLVVLVALCVFLTGAVSLLYLVPLFTLSATVTIVPAATVITLTDPITVVTGTPTTQQLAGRVLSSVTMSQAQTVPTTGTAHQQAQAAHGYITFYNGQPSVQVVTAGTLITGASGVAVVTEQDAIIPAAVYPTFGQVTVSAQATITGPASNLKAGDIYGPCCRLNVSAVNSAFTGGQDARTYQTVTQQDITTVASHLKTSLDQSVQAALQTQVRDGETLLTPLPCNQNVQPDRQPGQEATQVHITVNETCTGEVYNTAALHTLALQAVTQEATRRLGEGYRLTGYIQTTIARTTPKDHGKVELQVKSAGTWVYQFSADQLQHLKAIITGKSKAQATNALLQVPGVHNVSLNIKNGSTLPTDTNHIQLALLTYAL